MTANWATRREFGGDRQYRGKVKRAGRMPALLGNGAAVFAKIGRVAE